MPLTESLSIGIIGLVATTWHTAHRVNKFIEGIEGAPKAIVTTSKEIKSLAETLAVLHDLVEVTDKGKNPGHLRIIQLVKSPLEDCTGILNDVQIFLTPYVKSNNRWKSLAWRFKQSDLQRFETLISAYKTTLEITVATVSLNEDEPETPHPGFGRRSEFAKSMRESTPASVEGIRTELRSFRSKFESKRHSHAASASIAGTDSDLGSPFASSPGTSSVIERWILGCEEILEDQRSDLGDTVDGDSDSHSDGSGDTITSTSVDDARRSKRFGYYDMHRPSGPSESDDSEHSEIFVRKPKHVHKVELSDITEVSREDLTSTKSPGGTASESSGIRDSGHSISTTPDPLEVANIQLRRLEIDRETNSITSLENVVKANRRVQWISTRDVLNNPIVAKFMRDQRTFSVLQKLFEHIELHSSEHRMAYGEPVGMTVTAIWYIVNKLSALRSRGRTGWFFREDDLGEPIAETSSGEEIIQEIRKIFSLEIPRTQRSNAPPTISHREVSQRLIADWIIPSIMLAVQRDESVLEFFGYSFANDHLEIFGQTALFVMKQLSDTPLLSRSLALVEEELGDNFGVMGLSNGGPETKPNTMSTENHRQWFRELIMNGSLSAAFRQLPQIQYFNTRAVVMHLHRLHLTVPHFDDLSFIFLPVFVPEKYLEVVRVAGINLLIAHASDVFRSSSTEAESRLAMLPNRSMEETDKPNASIATDVLTHATDTEIPAQQLDVSSEKVCTAERQILTALWAVAAPDWKDFSLPSYTFKQQDAIALSALGRNFVQPVPTYDLLARMRAYEQSLEAERERSRRLESQYNTVRHFVDHTPYQKKNHARWIVGEGGVFMRHEHVIWEEEVQTSSARSSSYFDHNRFFGVDPAEMAASPDDMAGPISPDFLSPFYDASSESKVIRLEGMFKHKDWDTKLRPIVDQLELAIKQECEEDYGAVEKVHIFGNEFGENGPTVFVQFDQQTTATKALAKIDGSDFEGSILKTSFWPEKLFEEEVYESEVYDSDLVR